MRTLEYMRIVLCISSLSLITQQSLHAESLPVEAVESSAQSYASGLARALSMTGITLLDEGKTAQAEETFRKALELDSEGGSGYAFKGMGDCYAVRGQFTAALPWYEKAYMQVLNPPPDRCLKYALALFKTGQREKALQMYEIGRMSLQKGGMTAPDVDFRKILFTPTRFESVTRTAIAICAQQDNYENSAIRECQEAIRLLPSNALSYFTLGNAYERKQLGSPEARAAWKKAVELGTGDVRTKAQENLKR